MFVLGVFTFHWSDPGAIEFGRSWTRTHRYPGVIPWFGRLGSLMKGTGLSLLECEVKMMGKFQGFLIEWYLMSLERWKI